jgi:hypothetical protein
MAPHGRARRGAHEPSGAGDVGGARSSAADDVGGAHKAVRDGRPWHIIINYGNIITKLDILAVAV